MTKSIILIVGLDDKGKPHAAKFDFAEAEAVRKAAALMGFRTALPKAEEGVALADRLPPGKLFAAGKGMVPFCKLATYEQLVGAIELEPEGPKPATSASKSASKATGSVHTAPWADLTVGDTVIAPEKKPREDGFWRATVVGVSKGGSELKLRWLDGDQKQPPFTLNRRAVALLYPG